MNFIFSDVVLERALESSGVVKKEDIASWIKNYIRDDFDCEVTNNQLINNILQLTPSKIEDLSNSFTELKNLFATHYNDDTMIRLFVFAFVMVNDALRFKEYCNLRNREPMLYMRFNNISHDDRFLVFHFDEFDE